MGLISASAASAASAPGTVWTWGSNWWGQLGDGTTTDRSTPASVNGMSGVKAIATGHSTIAVKSGGTVWAWGRNKWGELGDGTTIDRYEPVQVKMPDGTPLRGVVAAAVSADNTFALKADGTVWAWGENDVGQLGNGTFDPYPRPPHPNPAQVTSLNGMVAIATGECNAIALKSDGTVWGWGWNDAGQLGDGTTTDRYEPTEVILSDGTPLNEVVAIACGYWHTMALKSDGTVWAWGDNTIGQLGDGTSDWNPHPTPVQVNGLSEVTAIAGGDNPAALKQDGTVWQWVAGVPTQVMLSDGTPLSGVHALAGNGTVALKSDGTVWALCYPPVQVTLPDGTPLDGVIAITDGSGNTAALRSPSSLH